ncbi:VanZ family protein [Curtobacterium sp. MCBD17_040]|uniref:VanZ family protein n=1 Tax=Curtobacterium sp. MCBD17_040 TaxID=2175674 RepID=UPI0011B45B78|nr:VanZ family protein [Curtobacterium sp. MCBD17_040]WIB65745.1 VanZ family protein [Curtobacterium sp. MCBD17_040]
MIPAFPVLIPAAVVIWGLLVWRLRRAERLTVPRLVTAAVACMFGVVLRRSVLFPYPVVVGAGRATLPPWPVFVQLIPVATVPRDPSGMILNVVLFVPIGVLLPFLVRGSALRLGTVALLLSVTIELVQLIGDMTISTGRVADIDDIIGNTVGALIGIGFIRLLARAPQVARLAALFSWQRENTDTPVLGTRRKKLAG